MNAVKIAAQVLAVIIGAPIVVTMFVYVWKFYYWFAAELLNFSMTATKTSAFNDDCAVFATASMFAFLLVALAVLGAWISSDSEENAVETKDGVSER